MNLNASSRFAQVPVDLDIQRSRFDRSFSHKTTGNAGECIPVYLEEVLPGDTFDVDTSVLCRMATPLFPVMDNAFLDLYYFFVPNRLVWEHWEAFNGQNDDTYWTQPVEYNVPGLYPPLTGWDKGSLADYFGIPTKVGDINTPPVGSDRLWVNALPFRAYVKVWNDWFRDQNYMNPAYFSVDDSDRQGRRRDANDDTPQSAIEDALYGGRPLQAAKLHDYFTSVLPQPQKGPGVSVPTTSSSLIPVGTYGGTLAMMGNRSGSEQWNTSGMKFGMNNIASYADVGQNQRLNHQFRGTGVSTFGETRLEVESADAGLLEADNYSEPQGLFPMNLAARIDGAQFSMLVNDIRLAFQLQKLYERDARGGTRYIEILKSHFGVQSPDGRLQRSEFLGHMRQPIAIKQVVQQSATQSGSSPLGSTGAFSLTAGTGNSFVKSFTEHGYIIGIAVVRTEQSYQNGLNAMWSRKRRFDYYWPVLANIGEQPVFKREILWTAPSDDGVGNASNPNDEAFGYQEAWASYRYHPNMISSTFRSNYDEGSLDAWHYASDFDGADPETFVADDTFMWETAANVDRTLAVQSSVSDQFIFDFYFKNYATRPMPLYSVPGLVDHH